MVKDPVCGMNVDETMSKISSKYQGKTYYFCSTTCKQMFEKNPKNYVK
jgi:YHS domain-containing protein